MHHTRFEFLGPCPQAKFKVPRNLKSSKEWSTAFRPTLHLVGAVCHGVCEVYFLCHADQRKDSNQNISVICAKPSD